MCYSTLPDHYRLINKVGGSVMNPSEEANLLPSGSFEDDSVITDWRLISAEPPGIFANGYLLAKGPQQGHYSLQLIVRRKKAGPVDTTAGSRAISLAAHDGAWGSSPAR